MLSHKDKYSVSAEIHRALGEMKQLNSLMAYLPTCDSERYHGALDMYGGLRSFVERQMFYTHSDERRLFESRLAREVSLEHDAAHHFKPYPN